MTALERLDYDVADGWDRIPDEILRDDVDRVAAAIGRRPMVQEYDEHGCFAPITVARRFGDGLWEKSMVTLGYDGSDQSDDAVSDGELAAAVDDVATDLGRAPRRSEFDDLTEYDPQTVANRFGNGVWRDALEELGYVVSHLEEADVIPGAALRRDLRRVVDELGEVPTVREYDSLGQYSAQTIANRFGQGSWTTALEELDFDDQSGNSLALSVEALQADVERVVDELEKRPTAREYNEHGSHSATTIANRFGGGSWLGALRELGIVHETARRDRIPDERLAADVERVTDEMGRVPTKREYTEQGEYTGTTIANRLSDGTWADALARLGYERDDGASAVDCKDRTVETVADDTTDRGEPAQ